MVRGLIAADRRETCPSEPCGSIPGTTPCDLRRNGIAGPVVARVSDRTVLEHHVPQHRSRAAALCTSHYPWEPAFHLLTDRRSFNIDFL